MSNSTQDQNDAILARVPSPVRVDPNKTKFTAHKSVLKAQTQCRAQA